MQLVLQTMLMLVQKASQLVLTGVHKYLTLVRQAAAEGGGGKGGGAGGEGGRGGGGGGGGGYGLQAQKRIWFEYLGVASHVDGAVELNVHSDMSVAAKGAAVS